MNKISKNRIVIDYQGEEKLVLLAGFEINGNEIDVQTDYYKNNFDVVKRYDNLKDYTILKNLIKDDQEGFVIRFDSGFRMKIKGENYLRLHKIMTNVSSISIWEYLKENKNINEIINNVPDEFMQYVKKIIDELRFKYNSLEQSAKIEFVRIRNYVNLNSNFTNKIGRKKDFALEVQKLSNKKLYSILFAMYDSKDYSQIIWKMLRPEYEQPFKTKIEDNEH